MFRRMKKASFRPDETGSSAFRIVLTLHVLLGLMFGSSLIVKSYADESGYDQEMEQGLSVSKTWFLKGISAFQDDAFEEAVRNLEQSLKTPTPWEEYTYFYLLKAHWGEGHVAETLGLCKAFEAHFPDSLLIEKVRMTEALGYEKVSAGWLACRTYEDLLKEDEGPEVRLRYGETLESLDRVSDAYANYQVIRKKWPRSAEARTAKERAKRLESSNPGLRAKQETLYGKLQEANLCFREGAYRQALSHYRELRARRLPHDVDRKVLKGQALAMIRTGNLDSAHGVLRTLMKRFPGSREEVEILLAVGKAYWLRNGNQQAYPLLRRLVEVYTDSEEAMRASYIMGRILEEEGNLSGAIAQFRRTRFLFPETEWEREAAWWEAWCYYRAGNYLACAEHLRECDVEGVWIPELVPRALYWRSRCLEKAGRRSQSRDLYRLTNQEHPESFYGILAERRLQGGSLRVDSSLGGHVAPGGPKEPCWAHEIFQKLKDPIVPLLLEAGLKQEAVSRLKWLQRRPEADHLTMEEWVEAYSLAGEHGLAIQLARKNGLLNRALTEGLNGGGKENLRFLRAVYPLPYWELIKKEADDHRLDPFLVAGLIHQESLFTPDALSSAGAVGLMQIMPSTGKNVAARIGMKGFRASWLKDPEMNIRIGTAYLASLVDRYGTDWHKVLANYNAGPQPVAVWTARMPRADMDEFVETINYRETRLYVKKVLYNTALYKKLYNASSNDEG